MQLSRKQVGQFKRLVELVQQISSGMNDKEPRAKVSARTRRSGKDLVAFKKLIKAERKKGVPVAALAEKHGVTTSYLYQL